MHHIANHNKETGLLRSGLELNGYDDLRYKSSIHYTYCFNVFVLMTFFNKFNARKLEDQFFILSGLFRSSFYMPILGSILVLQIIIISFTGIAFRCAPGVSLCPFFSNLPGSWNLPMADLRRIWRRKHHLQTHPPCDP